MIPGARPAVGMGPVQIGVGWVSYDRRLRHKHSAPAEGVASRVERGDHGGACWARGQEAAEESPPSASRAALQCSGDGLAALRGWARVAKESASDRIFVPSGASTDWAHAGRPCASLEASQVGT